MPKRPKTSEPNIVLFPEEVYLKKIKRNDDGSLKSGWVINGDWHLEIRDGFVHSMRSSGDSTFVMRWPVSKTMQEVVVKRDDDYNDVIQRAREKLNAEATRNI